VLPGAQDDICLRLDGIHHQFGSLKVLTDVSLIVHKGERRGIIGPNGAGKTTLFNIIAGELIPTQGRVFYEGDDITRRPTYRRAAAGVARTFQTTALFPKLTLIENVVLALQALRPGRMQLFRPVESYRHLYEEAAELLERMGFRGRERTVLSSMSYGEQRQVEIILALAQKPRLLLLDEPTAGLSRGDVPLVTEILKTLGKDVTLVLIEHDMDVVFGMVDQITVLHNGQLVAEDTVQGIRDNALVQEIYLGGKV
jgi:branched-chain amino acid transport system ATP-binding protein